MYSSPGIDALPAGRLGSAAPKGTQSSLWPSFGSVAGAAPNARDDAVAVIGIAGRFPKASTVEELWERLRKGEDCVVEVPEDRWERSRTFRLETACRWGGFIDDFDKFDFSFFETDWWVAVCTDPQERVLLELVWHLLERSGYSLPRLRETCRSAVGLYLGATSRDYGYFRSPFWFFEAQPSASNHGAIANRISHFFDLRGPSMAVDTFCSSAAVALHLACRDLLSGDCRVAIAGGVSLILHPDRYEILSLRRHLGTHQNSRSFADGDGYIPAEAAAVVLLKPLANAVNDGDNILAVIRATAMNHGGRSSSFGVPNLDGQTAVIDGCLRKSGLTPSDVDYIEASASGASLGDPLELAALRRVFDKTGRGERSWPIGTVKSNVGHAEAASAMAQLAKVLLQFEHGQIAPSIKTEPPNPHIDWSDVPFHLVHDLCDWERPPTRSANDEQQRPRRALLNSFGAGGTNVCLLLEEHVPADVPDSGIAETVSAASGSGEEAIVLSARDATQLRALIESYLEFATDRVDVDVGDVAYSLQIGRKAMKSRVAIVARNREELIAGLTACLRCDLTEVGRIEAEVPVFFGEVAGANLFVGNVDGSGATHVDATSLDVLHAALEWTKGALIPWSSLRQGRRRLVLLPTYPFARERCWPEFLTNRHPGLDDEASTKKGPMRRAPARSLDPNRATYVAPRSTLEQSLVEIWQDTMRVEHLGVKDGFFDVGGDSMLANLVINRCQEAFGVGIDVALLLNNDATIERMAVALVSELATAQIAAGTSVEAMIDHVMRDSAAVGEGDTTR